MDDSVPGQLSARLVPVLVVPSFVVPVSRSGRAEGAGQGDKRTDACPGASWRDVPVRLAVVERWAGNVQVRPWGSLGDELPQKGAGDQGATPTIGCD